MKKLKFLISVCFVFFISEIVQGQSSLNHKPVGIESKQTAMESFKARQQDLNNKNEIFIIQVGNQNRIHSNIVAERSNAVLKQTGDNNHIALNINARSLHGEIFQTGSHNNIFDNIYAPNDKHSLNLTQHGEYQHFERYGSNSIGDKLQFEMTGDFKSIIVRNFQ